MLGGGGEWIGAFNPGLLEIAHPKLLLCWL